MVFALVELVLVRMAKEVEEPQGKEQGHILLSYTCRSCLCCDVEWSRF